ncbi:hypothetical protein C8Q77DRAFT_1160603 [Trametes polyzona]|nr:hypothetical protein C8Q77DRAFT_1160603 [Trametes polyzona]
MSLHSTLNYDVLLEIMKSCSHKSDCFSFLRTSRFFYEHGLAILLSHRLTFHDEAGFMQFIASLRRQGVEHFKAVRALQLTFHAERRAVTKCTDYSHPPLANVITSMTSLQTLSARHSEGPVIRLLYTLRTRLVAVRLDYLAPDVNDAKYSADRIREHYPLFHMTALLAQPSRISEELLSSREWIVDVPSGVWHYPGPMRRLDYERPAFPLEPPISSYPNLFCPLSRMDPTEIGLGWNNPWKEELALLEGGLASVFALGLICPVSRLKLSCIYSDVYDMLQEVLGCARPRHLTLMLWRGEPHPEAPGSNVYDVFRGQGVSRLQTLDIDMGLSKEHGEIDITLTLKLLLLALVEGCPLGELKMTISLSALDTRPPNRHISPNGPNQTISLETPSSSVYPLSSAERKADLFDLGDYALEFAQQIPTLRRAELVMDGPRDRWRKVTLIDGQLRVEDESKVGQGISTDPSPTAVHPSGSLEADGHDAGAVLEEQRTRGNRLALYYPWCVRDKRL